MWKVVATLLISLGIIVLAAPFIAAAICTNMILVGILFGAAIVATIWAASDYAPTPIYSRDGLHRIIGYIYYFDGTGWITAVIAAIMAYWLSTMTKGFEHLFLMLASASMAYWAVRTVFGYMQDNSENHMTKYERDGHLFWSVVLTAVAIASCGYLIATFIAYPLAKWIVLGVEGGSIIAAALVFGGMILGEWDSASSPAEYDDDHYTTRAAAAATVGVQAPAGAISDGGGVAETVPAAEPPGGATEDVRQLDAGPGSSGSGE